ncbi:MAG: siderophore ABC transporter substrate-binding protein [Pelagimonas sp.]|jgi:iron complex transport system substrate-binding protein|nr:siderophore ABC transporter substrate-binding protein [Pelagimonas sp.]
MKRTLLAGLTLAVCLPAFAAADTVTVETALGAVESPRAPKTVAVLDLAAVDTLEALDITIAGVPNPVYLDYLDDTAAVATPVGSLFEPDFEALAIMAPDLIIAGGRSSKQVGPLSRVSTTLDMTIRGGDLVEQAKARTTAYGKIFGKEQAAADLNAALDDKINAVSAAIQGKGTALIVLTNGGKVSAYGKESRFGWLHTATGLPEAHDKISAETHGEAVSFEFIAQTNPDWLLVVDRGAAIGKAGEAASATLDNPLVAGTKAGKANQIIYLNSGPLYIAGGGLQSMMGTLDDLLVAFGG